MHAVGIFQGLSVMSSKLALEDPGVLKQGSSPGVNIGGCEILKKKRNHTTEQCHAAPAHTPAFDHPQPAMPHMISFLFICKAGAVGSTKWSYCWTSDERGLKCHMKLINQGQVDVAVVGECSKSPGWRLNMLFKSLTCSFFQTMVKFTITESQDGLDTAPPP